VHKAIETMRIQVDSIELEGALELPGAAPVGVVLFAHGSGSSRLSPRNTAVARALRTRGMATLLFDLLTEDEARDRSNVFDMPLLARRLAAATRCVRGHSGATRLPIGYFGASTGAAAALIAAADDPDIAAIVSRGGRPDLAGDALDRVRAPTLLIVGGEDYDVIRLNQRAFATLRCDKDLQIVAGATHLFEEPGTLDEVVRLAGDWFLLCFGKSHQLASEEVSHVSRSSRRRA
jgi:pimeloyl-ACP methyl ester carboxylesterase